VIEEKTFKRLKGNLYMIYVGLSDRALRKLFIHNDIQIFDKVVHPCKAKEYANMLNNSKKDYILYDTNIMDYIDINKLIFVNNDLSTIPFIKKFKEELHYMFPGEIILNMLNSETDF
jgi:hypothetical protein